MKFETKFSIDDDAYYLYKNSKRVTRTCTTCKGTKQLKFENMEKFAICPDCHGDGKIFVKNIVDWKVSDKTSVGLVRVEMRLDVLKINYMLHSTGIGTGTVYEEENLFSSFKEAMAEVERRNEIDNE